MPSLSEKLMAEKLQMGKTLSLIHDGLDREPQDIIWISGMAALVASL